MNNSNIFKLIEKVCTFLLGILLVLLIIAILLPVEEPAKQQDMPQEIRVYEFSSAVDEKIAPEIKKQINEALNLPKSEKSQEGERKDKITVVVEAKENIDNEIKKAKGKEKNRASSVDKKTEYISLYIDAGKIEDLAENENVVKIYPEFTYHVMLDESVPMIKADYFWKAGYNGTGVKIAVLDTGIDKTHPMLLGKVVAERDFSNSGSAEDRFGHGTHVAGIIAGTTQYGGSYNGVAPGAQLINAKVLSDNGYGSTVGIIAGISWAVDNGAKIISMSLGAPTPLDEAVENSIKDAVSKGVIVVVASGNCGSGCPDINCGSFRGVTMPGSSPSVISVGAVDKNRNVACFSGGDNLPNAGIKPDFVAPGVDIKSSVPGNKYESKQGTSMATPHVSGAIALILNKNPQLKQDEIERMLEKTSIDLGGIGKDVSYGYGLIDMEKVLVYKEGMEFGVNFERSIVSGSILPISVIIQDDVPINNVTAIITKPDNTESYFEFRKNVYGYDYTDTTQIGTYEMEVVVDYGGNVESSNSNLDLISKTSYYTGYFSVISLNGDFGKIDQMDVAGQQFLSKNLTGSFKFTNTAPSELNLSTIIQLLKNNPAEESYEEIALPLVKVAGSSTSAISFNNKLKTVPDNYTLRIKIDYGIGNLANETNISVIDDLQPEILNISYNNNIYKNNPQVITAEVVDSSPVTATVSVSSIINDILTPTKVNYTTKSWDYLGNRKGIALTLFGFLDEGIYTASLSFCDKENNCVTDPVQFSVDGCSGRNILLVKTYEQKSVFEEIASADSSICLSALTRSMSNTPPDSYSKGFDALIWSTGTELSGIDDSDATALTNYYNEKGRVLVEGSDIAFKHINDELMHKVLHSELKNDLFFSITSKEQPNLSISITRQHPVMEGMQNQISFNSTFDSFPDSVVAYNSSRELASWNSMETNGSAIILYEGENKKSLFLSFGISALGAEERGKLAANSMGWLLDSSDTDIKIGGIEQKYLFEGNVNVSVLIQSNAQSQSYAKIRILVDRNLVDEGAFPASEGVYNYLLNADLKTGTHAIKVIANDDFSVKENNYLNNEGEYEVMVYPKDSDLFFSGMSYRYDKDSGIVSLNISASNMGGTAADSFVKIYFDNNEVANRGLELTPGETKALQFELNSQNGIYEVRASIDQENNVLEYNETNNEMLETIYICNKEKVLVVNDNNAELYSTERPSSANEFAEFIEKEGYCVEIWDKNSSGTPSLDKLNEYDLLIWSSGDYFNKAINDEDAEVLSQFSKSMLVEGSDIGFDHYDDDFIRNNLHSTLSSDILLENEATIIAGQHPIMDGISLMVIDANLSPYPDSLLPTDGVGAASWENSDYAIIASNQTKYVKSADTNSSGRNMTFKLLLHFENNSAIGENNGIAADESDNRYNFSLINFNYTDESNIGVPGKVSKGIKLDGINDYIYYDVLNTYELDAADNVVEFWVKPFVNNFSRKTIFTKRLSFRGYSAYTSFGRFECDYYDRDGDGGTARMNTDTIPMVNNRWYHVACVFDKYNLSIYVNGELQDYVDVSLDFGDASSWQDFYIGREIPNNEIFFNGTIDEFKIYKATNPSEEIKNSYDTAVGNYFSDYYENQTKASKQRTVFIGFSIDSIKDQEIKRRLIANSVNWLLPPDKDNDGFNSSLDCDDNNADIYPGAAETCNNADDNCDGSVDENLIRSCGSNIGECRWGTQSCSSGIWGSCVGNIEPSLEYCDERDNDCDGEIDNNCDPCLSIECSDYCNGTTKYYSGTCKQETGCSYQMEYNSIQCGYIPDNDGDNFKEDADCNDSNANIYPGAAEVCDGIDNNCNNQTDEGCECIADADCGIGGCSGQICGKKDEVKKLITTCEWLPIYGCYWLTTCSCINSKCLWKETETFSECRAKKGEGYGFD